MNRLTFRKPLLYYRFNELIASWRKLDLTLLFLAVTLTIGGAAMIRSTQLHTQLSNWWQHLAIGGVGLILVLWLSRLPYNALLGWHWPIFGLVNLSLIAVRLFGVEINGARSWFNLGGFSLQPSEFAKLGLIITLAAVLHARPATSLAMMFRVLGITLIPLALIMLQPDLGTSLVFCAITLGMLYWANANPGWLILLGSPLVSAILYNVFFPAWIVWVLAMGAIAWWTLPWRFFSTLGTVAATILSGGFGGFLWNHLKPYQQARLTLFFQPEKDPLGGGYHLIQSRIAVGSGELWGRGLFRGTQTQLNFIPEQHNDFIFSAVGEELGLIGSLALLIIFWLMCYRLVRIALKANENFGSLLAVGVLSMIIFQAAINISMTIGLAPITGIPLPWVSYGGSSLLTNFLSIALVESVITHRRKQTF